MDYILENQYARAAIIVAAFWLGSYLITILMSLIEKATSKTKGDLDDKIIKAAKLPIRYLAILLGFFFALKPFNWSLDIKGKEFGLADIFFILIVVLVSFTLSRMLKTVVSWYSEREAAQKMNQTMFIFGRKVISVAVYIIAFLIILSQFNIEITPLLAGLGVAGLAISLGLKDTLANLFAAFFIVADKSINIGDWIQLEDGTKAYIEDISWRTVRIRTLGGNTVIVPSSVFANEKISSYDYPVSSFYTSISVGIAYNTDLEKAEYIASQAAEKVIKDEGISEQENNPIIRYKNFGDSAIEFTVIVKVDKVQDEGRVQHALIKRIKHDFEEAGIEIPFPQRVIHKM